MSRKIKLYTVLLLLAFSSTAQNNIICSYVKVLASDSLEGRKPGTDGGVAAAAFIKDQLKSKHLKLLFDEGFQYFDVVTEVELGSNNSLVFEKNSFEPGKDYTPYSFSRDTFVSASCVFAGYGFCINNDSLKWDDYQHMDVKDKWVMVLRGHPEINKPKSRFTDHSSDRNKMLVAKDHGAAGIILVTGIEMNKADELIPLDQEKSNARSGIAVLNISRKTADKILSVTGKTIKQLEQAIDSTRKSITIGMPGNINSQIKINQKKVKTSNVVAVCMSGQNTDEYIVVGAHYDHLGMGGKNSGSRNTDTVAVHNGADDNASGTAIMMELARRYSQTGLKGKFNIIFVAFSAEESGLLGSAWFVQHLPVDKKKIKLMLNFDMLGRLNAFKTLSVGGTGTFSDAEKLLIHNADTNLLKLSFSKEGYGPSDHASFYSDSIPVIYFNTGVHTDYHLPADDYDKINCNGMLTITDYITKVIDDICSNNYDLSFREAGPKNKGSQRMGLKVTLGIMPDFARQDVKGVAVGAVNGEGPAQKGGMKKGDVIIAIDGKTVNDIYEYMERLKSLTAGQIISVDVMRGGGKEVLYIQL
ncbi:MAG TPA: M20/M25/M40 family metallo-hydrolase [Bacteroidales bacterium]|nr:M20/M25/M40 family metallo-hydrolase [Bacteroidales bacterium]